MEDFKPLIYILIGIIWLAGSAYRKAEKQKQIKRNQQPKSSATEQTERRKEVNPPARSIEEMLREILEGKTPQPKKEQRPSQTFKPQMEKQYGKKPVVAYKSVSTIKYEKKQADKKMFDIESKNFLKANVEEGHRMTKDIVIEEKKFTYKPLIISGQKFNAKAALIYLEIMKPKFQD